MVDGVYCLFQGGGGELDVVELEGGGGGGVGRVGGGE